jgi:hypothetical protein
VELLIDLTGQSLRVGKRNVHAAVSKLGYIHIRSIERTVIVTLKPRLVHPLTVAAAAYEISDLNPERTIVVAAVEHQECWVFPGYMSALRKMASLASDAGDADDATSTETKKYLS